MPCIPSRERQQRGERERERERQRLCVSSGGVALLVIDMMPWWTAFVAVLSCTVYLAASQHWRKALYPSAYWIKRGTHSLVNPTFQTSVEDVNLLFEILLAGLQIEGEHRPMLIPDEELASLRNVEKLEVICEDILPKRLSEIRRLTAALQARRPAAAPLDGRDFERTVLTMVYAAQTLARISNEHQREVWTEALLQLFRAVQRDLAPS